MEFVKYAIGIAIGLFVLSKLYEGYKEGRAGASDLRHCMTCGVEAKPKIVTKGSLGVEIVLWLLFIFPGLIYSTWRMTSRHQACPSCGGTTLVPIDAPAAVNQRRLLDQSNRSA